MSKKHLKNLVESRHTNRRQFLLGTGSAFLTLPPLLSLMSREAAAQVVARKKIRSVIYYGSMGIDPQQLLPQAPIGMTPFAPAYSTSYKPLSSFSGPISRVIDASFVPMQSQMNLFKSLSLSGGNYSGHNQSFLSGTHSGFRQPTYGKSIDVILEQSQNVYLPTENIACKALRLQSSIQSFDRLPDGTLVQPGAIVGDNAMFNALFGSLRPLVESPTATQNKANNQLLVDRIYSDLQKLQSNSRISSEDKKVLDRYISSVNDLQIKVRANNKGNGPTCTIPTLSLQATGKGYTFPSDPKWNIQSTSLMFDNYIEMIKLAFMCDLTRVITIGNTIWSDMPVATSSDGGLHHECASSEIQADRQQWGIKKMLKLAQTLQGVTDPVNSGGTLLDNSLIFCGNELGSWTTSHSTLGMPAITFGSAGGFFKTGYYVDYSQTRTPNFVPGFPAGRPFKQLLQSIMQSMGVPKNEYMQFGDGNGFGEFKEGINQFGKKTTDTFTPYANEHNDTLPFIVK